MKVLYDIKEILEEELEGMKNLGGLNPALLDSVHKAVETIKYIDEICKDGQYDYGYSGCGRGGYMRGNSGGRSMNGRYSGRVIQEPYYYDQGYGMNGRYSSYNNRYSRDGATSHMVEKLNRMMEQTNDEVEREAIMDCIQRLSE